MNRSTRSRGRLGRFGAFGRNPGIHFLVLGALLFWGRGWLERGGAETEVPIRVLEVSAARVAQLNQQWQVAYRRQPQADEANRLVQEWIEEEILYREALATGLDRADPSVCNRLALNMQFLGLAGSTTIGSVGSEVASTVLPAQPPEPALAGTDHREMPLAELRPKLCAQARELGLDRDDPVIRRQMVTMMRLLLSGGGEPREVTLQQLEDFADRHPDRFLTAPRVRWSQIFLSRSQRGESLATDAQSLLARLGKEASEPQQVPRLGDPLPVRVPTDRASERELARRLGKDFARGVMEFPQGRWSGPLHSAFGLHLVWIHQQHPAQRKPWAEIEDKVRQGLVAELEQKRYADGLEQLLGRWQVEVQDGSEA